MKLSTTAKPNPRGVGGLSKTGEGIVALVRLLETNALLNEYEITCIDAERHPEEFAAFQEGADKASVGPMFMQERCVRASISIAEELCFWLMAPVRCRSWLSLSSAVA
jgi:hypothetical protein